MARIERFEDIEAWKKARVLTRVVYEVTNRGGFARDFGLKDQIRRAAVSVMSNIAEGYERDSGDKDFRHFLSLAKGSAGEVRSQLYVALDAGYLLPEDYQTLFRLTEEVCRMLKSFMSYLTAHRPGPSV